MTAQEIIHALNKEGITCYRIAQEADLSEANISKWKRGICQPTPLFMRALREYAEGKI